MKKVDKWVGKGKLNCEQGNHWYILHYPDYELCPLCGDKKTYDQGSMPEYNGYLVCSPRIEIERCYECN